MSLSPHAWRAEKLRIDRALGRAYAYTARHTETLEHFDELHRTVRRRSPLLRPVARPAAHDPVAALRNLAREHPRFVRPIAAWQPSGRSVLALVHSLATHLLARYPTPRFLAAVWFGPGDERHRVRRSWFRAHGDGVPLRRCLAEAGLTRRMEHALLASPHHLSVEAAARRAEVLALGGTRALADAVVATRLGRTFEHAGFWRTVVAFFVRHQDRLPLERVEPFVEFLHEARHVPARVHGADGAPVEAPVLPHFSMAGRTVASLSALVAEWRGVLALRGGSPIRWSSCGVDGLVWNVDGARWSVVELLDAESLADEGRRMRNCVGTYVERCRAGVSAVYSLRRRSEDGTDRSVLTIDVDAREPCVREALARCNRAPRGLPLELVRQWAAARRMRGKLSSE